MLKFCLLQIAVKVEIEKAADSLFARIQRRLQISSANGDRVGFFRPPFIDSFQESIPPLGGQSRILTYLCYLCREAFLPQKPALLTLLRFAFLAATIVGEYKSAFFGVALGCYAVTALPATSKTQKLKIFSLPDFAGFTIVSKRFLYTVKMRLCDHRFVAAFMKFAFKKEVAVIEGVFEHIGYCGEMPRVALLIHQAQLIHFYSDVAEGISAGGKQG